ncbi:hypothetical protein [Aquabacterium sp. CECT 9606]|uniref:hypothetical protein n=1 Tax=Aquabacterium sp. CECT 9606 TaxID=2845822 RepID=UPI001E5E249A|nr:hypothetical protein [Aquabacterium sp. CECT 9606]
MNTQLVRIAAARLFLLLGWPGCAGVAGMAIALALLAWVHQTHQAARPFSAATPSTLTAPAQAASAPLNPILPHATEAIAILRILESEAKANGLAWPQAEYRITPLSDEALSALEIRTTLKGPYPQLRQLITTLLDKQPAMALRELALSRPNGDAIEVEAKLHWTVFLADGWPPATQEDKP